MQPSVVLPDVTGDPAPELMAISRGRRAWVLFLLTCVAFLYLLDRNALLITQELIKREFALSDTDVGVLVGAAYGISYGLAGLPMGWLIDRSSRKRVLAAVVAIWSSLTALCGLGAGYTQLLLARVGIGMAESGGQPAAFSIMSDIYPPERRSSATGIYFGGAAFGAMFASVAGGYIAAAYGWRAVFLVYGLPGLLLALLILLTIPERSRSHAAVGRNGNANLLRQTLAVLGDGRLRLIYAALAVSSTVSSAISAWQFPYMMRVLKWDLHQVAQAGGLIGVFSIVGMVLSGVFGDRARRHRAGGPAWIAGIGACLTLAATAAFLLAPGGTAALVALSLTGFALGSYASPANATIGELAPPATRGLAFSIATVITNLVGATLGPLLTGVFSDLAAAQLPGVVPLRFGIGLIALLLVPSALLYFVAARRLDRRGAMAADQ